MAKRPRSDEGPDERVKDEGPDERVKDEGAKPEGGGGVDLEVGELIAEMEREGLRPAMIVFVGEAGEPRVATRGVDPLRLLQELARQSTAGRPCRRRPTRH